MSSRRNQVDREWAGLLRRLGIVRADATRSAVLRRIGHRGGCLLFFAFLDLVYGYSLFNPPAEVRKTPTLAYVAGLGPLWVWGVLWTGVGLICLVDAFRANDRLGFTAAIALKLMWGLIFLGGWMLEGVDRGYVTAAIWLSLAGFVGILASWPEPAKRRS